jgi:hypothetical protein
MMAKTTVATMATTDQVARAHQRQLEAGWRRLGLRLPPGPAQALQKLQERTGATPVQIINNHLLEAASKR